MTFKITAHSVFPLNCLQFTSFRSISQAASEMIMRWRGGEGEEENCMHPVRSCVMKYTYSFIHSPSIIVALQSAFDYLYLPLLHTNQRRRLWAHRLACTAVSTPIIEVNLSGLCAFCKQQNQPLATTCGDRPRVYFGRTRTHQASNPYTSSYKSSPCLSSIVRLPACERLGPGI